MITGLNRELIGSCDWNSRDKPSSRMLGPGAWKLWLRICGYCLHLSRAALGTCPSEPSTSAREITGLWLDKQGNPRDQEPCLLHTNDMDQERGKVVPRRLKLRWAVSKRKKKRTQDMPSLSVPTPKYTSAHSISSAVLVLWGWNNKKDIPHRNYTTVMWLCHYVHM